jgi:hypothetical protein
MESVELCPRELTGENSPLYTYQPTKMKTDRVPVKYFFLVLSVKTNARSLSKVRRPKGCHSRTKEIQLFGCSVARCLGNAAESVEQTLDAMPDCDDRMAAAAREFRAGDTSEFELRQ